MNEDTEAQAGIKKILFLNRTQFYQSMRDAIYDEKPQTSAFVNITDVFDFIYALGLEDAILFAFAEDDYGVALAEVADDDDLSSIEVSSLEDSDTE